MHLTIKERVELVLMSGADGVCYYYLNCFICFGALFMAQNVCYYYLNCFICFGALFMAHPVHWSPSQHLFFRRRHRGIWPPAALSLTFAIAKSFFWRALQY